jgi:hypothetical protein
MKAKFVNESLREQEELNMNDENTLLVNEKPFDDDEDFIEDEDEDVVTDEFETALRNELTVPEYARRTVSFRLRGNPNEVIDAVPMAKMKDGSFLMKVGNTFRKFDINDIVEESLKSRSRK